MSTGGGDDGVGIVLAGGDDDVETTNGGCDGTGSVAMVGGGGIRLKRSW